MYQKEIIYLGLNQNGSRIGSAGFLKVEMKDRQCRFMLKLQNVPHDINGRFPIRVYDGADWKEMASMTVQAGAGLWEESIENTVEKVRIQILLPKGYTIEGQSHTADQKNIPYRCPEQQSSPKQEEQREWARNEDMPQKRTVTSQEQTMSTPEQRLAQQEEQAVPTAEMRMAVQPEKREPLTDEMTESVIVQPGSIKEDKWEQILLSYDQIHPYNDDRVYVKIEPGDFIILQSKYQHLVNNSFLLHGFYNYRYVILGKEDDYYLGVPGVYYKREKMVALMFGFEAFECEDGVAEEGKFGYYLRKVEL